MYRRIKKIAWSYAICQREVKNRDIDCLCVLQHLILMTKPQHRADLLGWAHLHVWIIA